MKKLAIIGLLAIAGLATATSLKWEHNPPADAVTEYVLEHKPTSPTNAPWVSVRVPGTLNTVQIPEEAFGRLFRIAAVNSFGQSEWTEPVKLPEKIKGLRIVLEITP